MKQGPVNKRKGENAKAHDQHSQCHHELKRGIAQLNLWTSTSWHRTHNEFKYDIPRDKLTTSTCLWHDRWGGRRNVHKVQGAWQSCVAASVDGFHYIILGQPHVLPCHTGKLLDYSHATYDLKQGTWHYNYKFSSALFQSEEWCN